MVNNSKYYKSPLTKLKKLMDDEITKDASSDIIGKLMLKIISCKRPKICYRIKNSFKLSFLDSLPEKLQDELYKIVIK